LKFPPFEYLAAGDLREAAEALADEEDAKVLAGGQSLLPLMALRLARPSLVVDLGRVDPGPVALLGTAGGSLAHSDPAAELPAVMVALGASVRTVSASAGERTVACGDLFTGYFSTSLAHDELISRIHIPAAPSGSGASWCEWAPRAGDFADAGVGVCLHPGPSGPGGGCGAVQAAASGVAPTPVDLTPVLSPLLEGVAAPDAGVLRAVAAAVEAECVSELAGLLAARAVHRAFASMGSGAAAGVAA
jgi:CO/xanthine dehydrogenase FAD-binding subunit